MEVLRNLRILNDLDDETAAVVVQLALEEINGLLAEGRRTSRHTDASSDAERALGRTREELQRQARKIASRTLARVRGDRAAISTLTIRPSGIVAARHVYDQQQARPGKRPGGGASGSTATGRRQQSVLPTIAESSSSPGAKKSPETRLVPSQTGTREQKTSGVRPKTTQAGSREPLNTTTKPPATQSATSQTGGREQSNRTDRPPATRPAPSQTENREPLPTTEQGTCNVCMEEHILFHMAKLLCDHYYCSGCLTEMFKGATTDESRYPPQCCQPIPLDKARKFLHWKITKDYEEKKVEWDTKDRTYCSNKNCLLFILPKNIRGKEAECTKCGKETCSKCKKAAHGSNAPCEEDQDLLKALSLIEKNKWQRCKDCGVAIERTVGCNHISCICGKHFCYECGKEPWHTCECPYFPQAQTPPDLNDRFLNAGDQRHQGGIEEARRLLRQRADRYGRQRPVIGNAFRDRIGGLQPRIQREAVTDRPPRGGEEREPPRIGEGVPYREIHVQLAELRRELQRQQEIAELWQENRGFPARIGCFHRDFQLSWDIGICETCHYRMDTDLYYCRECRMKICRHCRTNRFPMRCGHPVFCRVRRADWCEACMDDLTGGTFFECIRCRYRLCVACRDRGYPGSDVIR